MRSKRLPVQFLPSEEPFTKKALDMGDSEYETRNVKKILRFSSCLDRSFLLICLGTAMKCKVADPLRGVVMAMGQGICMEHGYQE